MPGQPDKHTLLDPEPACVNGPLKSVDHLDSNSAFFTFLTRVGVVCGVPVLISIWSNRLPFA